MASLLPYIPGTNNTVANIKDLFGIEKNPYSVFSTNGTHHTCYYDIIIPLPTNVLNMFRAKSGTTLSATTIAERLNYYCTEVVVPQTSIDSVGIRVGGEKIEIPYDRSYGEFQTTFYVDGGYEGDGGTTLNAIHAWFDTIYPPITRNFAYQDEYSTTVQIAMYTTPDAGFLFGKENIVIINLMEAWPTSMQGVQLSGRTGTEPSTFIVTWKYRYAIVGNMNEDQSILSNVLNTIQNGFRLARSVKNIWSDAKNTYDSLKKAWENIKDWF